MTRLIIAVVLLTLLGGGAYYGYTLHAADDAATPDPTAKVVRGDILATVASTGRVESNLDVDIKCKASGPIIKLPFDVSDVIHKGDLLAELDPVDEEPNVGLREAAVLASKSKLETAKQTLVIAQDNLATARDHAEAALKSAQAHDTDERAKAERMAQLLTDKLAAQEDYETAKVASVQAAADLRNAQVVVEELKAQALALELRRQDIKLAEAQLKQDQINMDIETQRMKDTTVYSPMDGTVSALDVQIGSIIASAITNVGGGTTILTISDLSHLFILASVDESDIGRVKLGQDVNVTADSFPGVEFKGKVVRIATRGVNTSNVVTFEVKIEVVGANKNLLKPEMTTNVEIVVAQKNNVLMLPLEGVLRKGDAKVATVVTGPGQTQERPVEVGISDGVVWEILKGVQEGETVVLKRSEAEDQWHTDPNNLQKRGLKRRGGRR